MSKPRNPDEEILHDLITGARRESDPEVQRSLEADPALARAWAQHRRVEGALARSGDLERSVLGELADSGLDQNQELQALEARTEQTLERLAQQARVPRRVTWQRSGWFAAAAILIGIGTWSLRQQTTPPATGPGPGGSIYLGGDSDVPLLDLPGSPVAHDSAAEFTWRFDAPDNWGGSFEIRVRRAGEFQTLLRDSLDGSADTTIWRWKPNAEQWARLPHGVPLEWEVAAISGHGDTRVSMPQSFSLSP